MKGDILPGGKGDKAKPSDFDPRQLAMGIKVEMEHTKSRRLAREIAMDHLSEDPRYYSKLKKVHAESTMHSFEELLQRVVDVYERLAEATPPPFKAADRAAAGMKPLQGPKLRSGATPPPIPAAAKKKEPSADTKAALADIKKPAPGRPTFGTKGLGITRSYATGTAKGGSGESKTKENVVGLGKVVAHRAKLGESVAEIRDILGEGGGSRASKDARQMKHYKATQPEWLRDTQAGKDPHYPYGMNKPSEKMYSRGANRARKDPLERKASDAERIKRHKESGKGWIGGKAPVGAASFMKKR